ncbi:hypothetical protein LA03_22635 [Burkholderia gladioli]|uniref:DUF899 family protein n=1 Tax=Burkholderia gladioli TaxID=28095 RepID=UPI0005107223|nr:DUF899 family protein [Burkholderia gladioli]KGE08143.1 hypothetical protein LA03_22635 [Burkholderia gladioli]
MNPSQPLIPAAELAALNRCTYPNESAAYRQARNALLVEEIELRGRIERVAEQRRALPPGGAVTRDYRFEGEGGGSSFAELFGRHDTLVVYSYMFGPTRQRPCPMCTSLLGAWNGEARDIGQRVSLVAVARAPWARLDAFRRERGWRDLRLYTDLSGEYSRDYHAIGEGDSDIPALNVFTRRDGTIRHFYGGEMSGEMSDPGQDPRGAPDLMPIWTVLDMTPAGRGGDWYPKLDYGQ